MLRPTHRYRVPADARLLLLDPYYFRQLAHFVRESAEEDLDLGARLDPGARHDRLLDLAFLDALDGSWELAVSRLDAIAHDETDPVQKLMTGLTIRVWADARRAGGTPEAFASAFERRVSNMPYPLVEEQLAMLRQMSALYTREFCVAFVSSYLRDDVRPGALSQAQASTVVFQRYVLVNLVPVAPLMVEVLERVIDAHERVTPAERSSASHTRASASPPRRRSGG